MDIITLEDILSKYGKPLFPIGGIVGDKDSYVIYGEYNFLKEDKVFSWIIRNYKLFLIGNRYELYGMEFIIINTSNQKEIVLSQELSEELSEIWNKPVKSYLQKRKNV